MQVYGEKWNSVPVETKTRLERLLLHAAPYDRAAALKAVLALRVGGEEAAGVCVAPPWLK